MKVMPEHWCYVNLLEIAPINANLVDPRKDEYRGMTLIAPDHIESGSGRILDKVTAVNQGAISGKYLAKKNSIIYSKIRPYLMKAAIIYEDALCSADMYPLDCTEQVIPEYLLNVLLSDRFTVFANSCSNRTGIPKINREELAQFRFRLPPLPEQTAIAELLSNWDQAIEKTVRLIAAKEKRFSWLRNKLINRENVKGEWRGVKLGEVFSERTETQRSDLPLLSITREEGVIPRNDVNRKDTSNEDKSKYLRICPGDIGYNTMRMWQGVSALSSFEGIVSPAYTICTHSKDVYGEFMAYLFKTPYMIYQFYRYSQGLTSDTWNLKFRHFKEIKVLIPPLDQQKQIASILNTARREIDLLKKQAEAYRKQKRGLMQKLLTGTWRVNTGGNRDVRPIPELRKNAGSEKGAL